MHIFLCTPIILRLFLPISLKKRVTKIHRVIQNKNAHHNIKERSRTLHEFTLSIPFKPQTQHRNYQIEEFQKIMTSLKQFKDLKCLNIDLFWLELCHKANRLRRFIESLKHLKSLSTIYFFITIPSSKIFHQSCDRFLQLLGRVVDLSRMKLHFSVYWHILGDFNDLEGFSKLERFKSVHITGDYTGAERIPIPEIIAVFKDFKYLSRFSLSLDVWRPGLRLEDIFGSLKKLKSVKHFKLVIQGTNSLSLSVRRLPQTIKEIAQVAHLDMTLKGFRETPATAIDKYLFNQSLAKMNAPHTIRTEFDCYLTNFLPGNLFIIFLTVLIPLLLWYLTGNSEVAVGLSGILAILGILFVMFVFGTGRKKSDFEKRYPLIKDEKYLLKKELQNMT